MKNEQFKLSILCSFVFFIVYGLLSNLNDSMELKIDVRWIFSVLWFSAPIFISFITSYSNNKYRLILSCSLIILFPLIGTLVHYFFKLFGMTSDFSGLNGSFWFFKIIFFMGMPSIILGILLGLVSNNRKK